MTTYKDKKRGTYYCSFYYIDWTRSKKKNFAINLLRLFTFELYFILHQLISIDYNILLFFYR